MQSACILFTTDHSALTFQRDATLPIVLVVGKSIPFQTGFLHLKVVMFLVNTINPSAVFGHGSENRI